MVNFISPHGSNTDITQQETGRVTYTQLNQKNVKTSYRENTYYAV